MGQQEHKRRETKIGQPEPRETKTGQFGGPRQQRRSLEIRSLEESMSLARRNIESLKDQRGAVSLRDVWPQRKP